MKQIFGILVLIAAWGGGMAGAATVLVEAESFAQSGGWLLDQQFMDQMGSPYLLAHGINAPVADAVTTVAFPAPGAYQVWVRTRDWVGYWKEPYLDPTSPKYAQGAPGQFQLLVNGQPLAGTFGIQNALWHWQKGGYITINQGQVTLALHDLTGYEGRCDAILFSTDTGLTPPNADPEMKNWRRTLLGQPEEPLVAGDFDLVVIGGGMAGTCAAVSAARQGLTVALIQDRPVLGGNNSSEIRVGLGGGIQYAPYPHIGDIVNELDSGKSGNRQPASYYDDAKKMAVVQKESNITLFMEHRANEVTLNGLRIAAVVAQNTRTGQRLRFTGRTYADCTGDGVIGYLAGADWEMTVTDSTATRMGRSNLWREVDTGVPVSFPHLTWALNLYGKAIPTSSLGDWFWESGYSHNPFDKNEYIRDWNLRALYGAWDAIKNDRKLKPNSRIEWQAYVTGKRETRRLLGDYILTRADLMNSASYPDGCVPTSWSIDLHYPDDTYGKNNGLTGDEFISRYVPTNYPRPYWVPYRCLYSRNIENLFMAGRNISVTHEALGTVRVMRTTGMMGEIVGLAASICTMENTTPRGVYTSHLSRLKALMGGGDQLPSAAPAALRVVSAASAVDLDWDDNNEPDFKTYAVYRSTVSGSGYVQIAAAVTSKFTDNTVKNGVVYFYVVAAVDTSFNQSGYSNEVSAAGRNWFSHIGLNWGRSAQVAVSSAYQAAYAKEFINDGYNGDPGFDNKKRWLSASSNIPAYVTFTWPAPRYLSGCRIRSGWNDGANIVDAITDFVLQYNTAQGWVDIPGTQTLSNTLTFWNRIFPAVSSNQYRLKITATPGNIARVWEVEWYHPQADLNKDGRVNMVDLLFFSEEWLKTGADLQANFDTTGSPWVNLTDYAILGEFWGW